MAARIFHQMQSVNWNLLLSAVHVRIAAR
jgi:hypothetical protein